MAQIAGEIVHPELGKSIGQLLAEFDNASVSH